MILTITFCVLATGLCESRPTPDVTYPTIEACQHAGEMLAWNVDDYLTKHGLRVAGITCAAAPEDPAG